MRADGQDKRGAAGESARERLGGSEMRPSRILLLCVAGAALAACGNIAPLQPAPGQALPVKPLMAQVTPGSEQLLSPPTYARPERVDELIRRSEPRRADRFDLPPPTGGSVPLPIGADKETSSERVGPATPDE
jgi:hypothetical protein